MKKKLTKSLLKRLLNEGRTHREIAEITNYSSSNIGYWISKFGLNNLSQHKIEIDYKDKYYFNKIDTKEKAYILGFILADGYVNQDVIEISIAIKDIEILEFIQSEVGGNVRKDMTFNRKQRRFPRGRLRLYNNRIIKDIIKQVGGTYKVDRRLPNVNSKLEKYLLQGIFDADGGISWGIRKDRSKVWQQIRFTSQYKILEGVQSIIYNQVNIPTKIRPKSDGSQCYVMEFSGKKEVLLFLDYLYNDDFVILNRKYQNSNKLRLELEEFGKS